MEERKLIPNVFMWMFVGLLVTFMTGFYVSNNINMIYNIANNIILIIIIEFVLVIVLSCNIAKVIKEI